MDGEASTPEVEWLARSARNRQDPVVILILREWALNRVGRLKTVALTVGVGMAVAAAIAIVGLQNASTSSTVDGPITVDEVFARAQYWVDHRVPYDQSASYPDPDGRSYRTDCSGYVSEAWHLGSSYYTEASRGTPDFDDWSGKTNLASIDDALPGDAFLKVSGTAQARKPSSRIRSATSPTLHGTTG